MAVTQERFMSGMTYADYKAQMTRNRERLEDNERTVELPADDLAFFAQLPEPLHALAIVEDWCGDVIANLPVLGRLAEESGKIDLRVFLRDQNLDLIDQYLNGGLYRSIPVFVFFDQSFRELGHWIERPARVSAMMQEVRRKLFASDPALHEYSPDTSLGQLPEEVRMRVIQAHGAFREQNRVLADSEVVREIRALIEHGTPQQAGEAPRRASAPVAPPAHAAPAADAQRPPKVSITYCASCGYEPQTLALTSALMHEFVYDLAAIELIPWQDGAFDVVVDGDLIHSMYRDGGFPEHATIIDAVRERLARR